MLVNLLNQCVFLFLHRVKLLKESLFILYYLFVFKLEFIKRDFQNLIMLIKLGVLDFKSGVFILVLFNDLLDVADLLNIKSKFISISLFSLL